MDENVSFVLPDIDTAKKTRQKSILRKAIGPVKNDWSLFKERQCLRETKASVVREGEPCGEEQQDGAARALYSGWDDCRKRRQETKACSPSGGPWRPQFQQGHDVAGTSEGCAAGACFWGGCARGQSGSAAGELGPVRVRSEALGVHAKRCGTTVESAS